MEDCASIRQRLASDPALVAHFHIEDYHFLTFGYDKNLAAKTLTTVHNLPKEWQKSCPQMPLVAISNAQKAGIEKDFEFVEVVHNGIDPKLFTPNFNPAPDSKACFIGRLCQTKNPWGAASIALQAGVSIAFGGVPREEERDYFDKFIELTSRYSDQISFLGEVSDEAGSSGISTKCELLKESRALLFPIQWPEPFGLVIAEANACGTPVVAYDYPGSSVSELIINGVNGFKVKTEAEAVEALKNIEKIDRRGVYTHFINNFTTDKMADKYQAIIETKLPRYWDQLGI